MDLIARAWGDGLDFLGTELHRPKNKRAGRRGFGDMICEVSNLCQSPFFHEGGHILVPQLHSAFNTFNSLLPMSTNHWVWESNTQKFNKIVSKSHDWDSLNKIRSILHCHTEYDDYIKLDKSKFVECNDLVDTESEYATIQTIPFAQKCNYTKDHIREIQSMYDIKIVDIGGNEKLGPLKCAYIINKAKFHIGIDSGMSHFALTVKDKKDVIIHVPEKRITSASYRWIQKGYNVELI